MIELALKQKYLFPGKAKFGGKKKAAGNSGGTGRVAKAKKRSRVVSSRNSPDQYMQWFKAVSK